MDNVVVISLERAPERREKMKNQLSRLNIDAFIMDAVDGNQLPVTELDRKIKNPGRWRDGDAFRPGEIGCARSMINAISYAKEHDWSHVVVMEDDVILSSDFWKGLSFMLKIVPKDWEHVMLGGHIYLQQPPVFQPNVVPVTFKVSGAYCYVLRNTAYDKVIQQLSKMELPADDAIELMVRGYGTLRSYIFFPFLAYPEITDSYIWETKNPERIHPSIKYFKDKI